MTACAHGMVVLLAGAHGGGECWPIYVGIWLCVCGLVLVACYYMYMHVMRPSFYREGLAVASGACAWCHTGAYNIRL